ncbi:unnamed protein product [Cylicostephanus goldi]|uniref:Uncharacterized protein n=1 Tax=Cylicostephanus goldi TaxID=71465 RepID=A0A3P6QF98_CYLGO|nr:unnamed protein product [Cylicostephanus goldi]
MLYILDFYIREFHILLHFLIQPSSFCIIIQGIQLCPPNVISCLTNSIVDGNIIHEAAVKSRGNGEQNFTIPDAIQMALSLSFTSFRKSTFVQCQDPLIPNSPLSRDLRLFLLLIAFERTVLIVFERATSSLTLFDSHMHGHSEGTRHNIFLVWHICLNICNTQLRKENKLERRIASDYDHLTRIELATLRQAEPPCSVSALSFRVRNYELSYLKFPWSVKSACDNARRCRKRHQAMDSKNLF